MDLDSLDVERRFSTDEPPAGAEIVVENRLAAEQWELHLAAPLLARGAAAWPTPPVVTYRAWLERLWSSYRPPGSPEALRPAQSAALWRQVIADSPEGSTLIGSTGIAAWAEDAHRRIEAWKVPVERLAARHHDEDFAVFLGWRRRYVERLEGEGWIDGARLEAALVDLASGDAPLAPPRSGDAPLARPARFGVVRLAAPFEPTPAARRLIDSLTAAGADIEPLRPASARARPVRLEAPDSNAEIAAAAEWAKRRLERSPEGRFAVVLPGLRDRAAEIRRAFAGACAGEKLCIVAAEAPRDARPLIGAAVNALELLSPRGTVVELGRWLRSPWFFDAETGERERAARLEAELRGELVAQIPFLEAYRRAGLRARLEARLPAGAARLDAALRELEGEASRAPSAWTRAWQRALSRLGGPSDASLEGEDLLVWNRALEGLGALTPILGPISLSRALAELGAMLARPGPAPRLTMAGIHVLDDLAGVGPGYEAAWVAGLTDRAFPRPVALNPLLPRALQVEHAMPWSSPADALARSRRQLSELQRYVPDLVLSWPATDRENPAQPSPLIRSVPVARAEEAGLGARFASNVTGARFASSATGARFASSATQAEPLGRPASDPSTSLSLEILIDRAPPAPPGRLRGGTRALDAAARCPLRAFLEFRLGAKPLEPWTRGVPPRLKGIALHRALELLYRRRSGHAALAAMTERERLEEASRCAELALDEIFAASRGPLRALYVLELRRMESVLAALMARELERAPFTVAALERSEAVELGAWRISARIDRLDALADGSLAIIDYKTGKSGGPADWFAARPRSSQLPVYAVAASSTPQSSAPLSALVIAAAGKDGPAYAGVWERPDDFPGSSVRLPNGGTLSEQIEAWRRDIGRLLAEHAGGDTRVFASDIELAAGPYAPLTRIYEQLALHESFAHSADAQSGDAQSGGAQSGAAQSGAAQRGVPHE